ncbi:peroxin 6 [Wolffia australiana]
MLSVGCLQRRAMGVGKREPLVLWSTRALLRSVLGPDKPAGAIAGLRLRAGILLPRPGEHEAWSDAVAASPSALKKLSLTSGSLVQIKNTATNSTRIVRILALGLLEEDGEAQSSSQHMAMGIFPTRFYSKEPSDNVLHDDGNIAFIDPLLAFNIGLHISGFNLVLQGKGSGMESLFNSKDGNSDWKTEVLVEFSPLSHVPKYASHVRVSFVKTPECSQIDSLRPVSPTEVEDRQKLIDTFLSDYFKVDRFLARGDVFGVNLDWNCLSELCVSCGSKDQQRSSANTIFFKVMAMEPSEEHILRVNRNNTPLVLGGQTPSPLPPESLLGRVSGHVPLQMDVVRDVGSILLPTLCPSALSSKLRVALLLFGPTGCGKRTVVRYVAHCLGLHVVEYSCHDLVSASEKKASVALTQAFNAAHRYAPSLLMLRNFDIFGKLQSNDGSPSDQVGAASEVASVIREFTEPPQGHSRPSKDDITFGHRVLLVAVANSSDALQPSIRRCFSHELTMKPLSEAQRGELLLRSIECVSKGQSDSYGANLLKEVLGQTSGFMPRDIRALVADAGSIFVSRLLNQSFPDKVGTENQSEISRENGVIDIQKDLSQALERSKKRNASALGTPKVPNVKWEDVGGLEEVKRSILDTVQLPLLHKELFSSGLRKRSGVLLYGPPGTGKTLLAKAVATECSLNFLSVKGPELINMYIGESEKNVRDIFEKARSARPCVIFFDELDSLAPARGASGDSGGVMDRVVSQMLAEIDGLSESKQDLFIIGASNRPDLIDPALLRPGRFDKLLYVGVDSEASKKERVLTSLTRKFKLHDNVSLSTIAKRCPPNFTGADMYALCTDAWFHAAKRKVSPHLSGSSEGVADDPDAVIVEIDDFIQALGELTPSLSMAELRKYEQLRSQFEGGK